MTRELAETPATVMEPDMTRTDRFQALRELQISPYDVPMTVQVDFEPEEAPIYHGDNSHPGCAAVCSLAHAYVGGIEITEMLSAAQIERIEEAALRELEA